MLALQVVLLQVQIVQIVLDVFLGYALIFKLKGMIRDHLLR